MRNKQGCLGGGAVRVLHPLEAGVASSLEGKMELQGEKRIELEAFSNVRRFTWHMLSYLELPIVFTPRPKADTVILSL